MQYIGILNQDWYTFTEAVVPLINVVRSSEGIEAEIKSLEGKLSSAIMHAMENGPQLEVKVCWLVRLTATSIRTCRTVEMMLAGSMKLKPGNDGVKFLEP